MDETNNVITPALRERIERRKRIEAEKAAANAAPVGASRREELETLRKEMDKYADLVPNVGAGVRADAPLSATQTAEQQLDSAIKRLDILTAYKMFSGKMQPKVLPGQRESIMISCPSSSHPDKHPSAWVNIDKQLWKCEGSKCGSDGGGVIDLVGAAMGITSPHERKGRKYNDIRREIGRKLGFTFQLAPDGIEYALPPASARPAAPSQRSGDSGNSTAAPSGPSDAERKAASAGASNGKEPAVGDGSGAGAASSASSSGAAALQAVAPPDNSPMAAGPHESFMEKLRKRAAQAPQPGAAAPVGTSSAADEYESGDDESSGSEDDGSGEEQSTLGTVTPIVPDFSESDEDLPDLDWRAIFPEDTFVKRFMDIACTDDVPEMYHLAHALLALGLTMGRNVQLRDGKPVHPNMFVCLLGKSGEGKSKSRRYLVDVLNDVLPYDEAGEAPVGVRFLPSPSSGPAMVKAFRREERVKTGNVVTVVDNGWVKGLIEYPELQTLMRSTAAGYNASMRQTLFEIFDGSSVIGSISKSDEGRDFTAHYSFGSALTTTQPDMLHRLLNADDSSSGFVNRWFFFSGASKKKIPIDLMERDFEPAKDQLRLVNDWVHYGRQPKEIFTIQWEPEAIEEFTKFAEEVIEPTKGGDGTSVMGRADLYMKKLILLLAANYLMDTVTVPIVQKAIAFWTYMVSTYKLLDSRIGRPALSQAEDKLEQFIRNYKGRGKNWTPEHGMPMSMINKACSKSPLTKNMSKTELATMLKGMTMMGVIELIMPDGKDGRRAIAYKVVDL